METTLKDYIFSTLAVIVILTMVLSCLYLVGAFIPSQLAPFALLIYIVIFMLLYGLLTFLYLRVLNHFLPLEAGSYLMSHSQFTLWKHHAVVGDFGRMTIRPLFPVFLWALYYKVTGAKIGRGVAVGGSIADPILTILDDYAVLGQDSLVVSHSMVSNYFFLRPVVIGRNATVGIKTVIMPGVEIGENSIVGPGSIVPMDTIIPPNEFWEGTPAKKIRDIKPVKK